VKTLAQLLHQKDNLCSILLEHIRLPENQPSLEPAFSLIVSLARDLSEDFYPFLSKFSKVIFSIVLTSKDTEVIEKGFKCYAYLLKYLRRCVSKNLPKQLKLFAPLLDPKRKSYVVIFACEAFEVVTGKYSKDHPKAFLKYVFNILLEKNSEV